MTTTPQQQAVRRLVEYGAQNALDAVVAAMQAIVVRQAVVDRQAAEPLIGVIDGFKDNREIFLGQIVKLAMAKLEKRVDAVEMVH